MSEDLTDHRLRAKPTFSDALIFRTKATLLQMNRAASNVLRYEATRFPIRNRLSAEAIIGQSVNATMDG